MSTIQPRRSTRAILTLGDQGASSITNFLVSFVALRNLAIEDFGLVAVAILTYGFALKASRATSTEPLLIRYSSVDPGTLAQAAGRAAGASLIIGLVAGTALVLGSAIFDESAFGPIGVLGAFLPLLLVQDAYRFAHFAAGRPSRALVMDLCWLLLTVGGFALAQGLPTSGSLILALWGVSGAVSALVGVVQLRSLPRPLLGVGWLTQQRDLGLPLLAEQVVGVGSRQFVLYWIAAAAGLGTLGSLHGARTLFGPMNVLFLGAAAYVVPEVSRLRTKPPWKSEVRRLIGVSTALLAALTASFAVALTVVPEHIATAAIGPNWKSLEPFIAPTAIATTGMAIVAVLRAGFRGLAAPKASLKNTALMAVFRLVLGVTGVAVGGGLGGAYGLAGANLLGAGRFAGAFRREMNQAGEDDPVPGSDGNQSSRVEDA